MMTGPLRVVPMFAALTRDFDATVRNRFALRSLLFASAVVLLAVTRTISDSHCRRPAKHLSILPLNLLEFR